MTKLFGLAAAAAVVLYLTSRDWKVDDAPGDSIRVTAGATVAEPTLAQVIGDPTTPETTADAEGKVSIPPIPTTKTGGKTPMGVLRGMAMQISYTADGIDPYLKEIDEIAALGANTLGISAAGYQEHAGSMGITIDIRKCPSPEQFKQLIDRAHRHGMRVVLMPVLLLSNPKGSEWRGVIQPPDWDEWFSSYLAYIKYFAKIGLDNNVEAMAVGAELISTESFHSRWAKVIDEVRRIYHGKLFYSSNWDHYRQVSFWDKLDWIGMTTYHKLADDDNPSMATLLASWGKIKKDILTWRKTVGKPILFTEVGWCSQEGASVEAWNYYRQSKCTKLGLEEQKKCYEAFIQTWRSEPDLAGAMWWEWTIDGSGPEDYGYTPKGKPAQKVLEVWYKESRRHAVGSRQ